MLKIKRKIINWLTTFFLLMILVYTRLVGLDWGLPYPMHPDERNMANAVQNLRCEIVSSKYQVLSIKECFNPHFFAYGQLPLYLAYLLIWVFKGLANFGRILISFDEATLVLRVISAVFSILAAIMVIKIIKVITVIKKEKIWWWLLVIFSPFFIQFSHFGTTESLLMLFYTLIIYEALKILSDKDFDLKNIFRLALFGGLAIATKISSVLFLVFPFLVVGWRVYTQKINGLAKIKKFLLAAMTLLIGSLFFGSIFSPHNLINLSDFISALRYESDVALGRYVVFYTQQFDKSLPVIFQLVKIFPFAIGPIGIIGLIGLIYPTSFKMQKNESGYTHLICFAFTNQSKMGIWGKKNKDINFLKIAFLIYFLPNAFIFAKWSRFMAPVFPVLLILGIVFLERIKVIKIIRVIIIIISILPGISYLLLYQKPDIRFQASQWIYENIPENSYILSETANVVDIPVINKDYKGYKSYNIVSFNFYDLDQNINLQQELKHHLARADYILVPSRRIFANYTCFLPDGKNNFLDRIVYEKDRCRYLKDKFPLLNDYYERLFSEQLGFQLIKEFNNNRLSLFNFQFLDEEMAEETLTVFDHPVIRIYKKVKSQKLKITI